MTESNTEPTNFKDVGTEKLKAMAWDLSQKVVDARKVDAKRNSDLVMIDAEIKLRNEKPKLELEVMGKNADKKK